MYEIGKDRIPHFSKSHYDDPQAMTDVEILQEKIQDLVNKELPEKCKNIFILSRIEGKQIQKLQKFYL